MIPRSSTYRLSPGRRGRRGVSRVCRGCVEGWCRGYFELVPRCDCVEGARGGVEGVSRVWRGDVEGVVEGCG